MIITDLKQAPPNLYALPYDTRKMIEANHAKGLYWDASLNAHRGCTKVSPGCENCFMLTGVLGRYSKMPTSPYFGSDGSAMFFPGELNRFQRDLVPKRYFSPIMGDPYHEAYPDEVVLAYHEALRRAPWHWIYSFTKRSERLAEIGAQIDWPAHVCAVVSVENEDYLNRIADLRASGALRIGVSFEPLIGRIRDTPALRRLLCPPGGRPLDIAFIGGESTNNDDIRPMEEAWAMELVRACLEVGVPVFFKQVGDVDFAGSRVGVKKAGRLLGGQLFDALPNGCVEHLAWAQVLAQAERARRRLQADSGR